MSDTEQVEFLDGQIPQINHPGFSRLFTWLASSGVGRATFDGLRRRTAGNATGHVLEIGAGAGHNFTFYDASRATSVDAIEPDATMLRYASERARDAKVPIRLTQAPAETLPFPDDTFDTIVVTMVFCSVGDPQRGLRELKRVLKPGGRLLMAEHVRSEHGAIAGIQTAMTPFTVVATGNCHWNRDTAAEVARAGFADIHIERKAGGLHPIILVDATKAS